MPKHILVVNAHPDGSEHHFCTALVDSYIEGAMATGHEIRRIDLASLDFPFLRSQKEFESRVIPPGLKDSVDAIAWADHLVFVFPLWLGTMPALLKAFLEQVMRPGVAFEYGRDGVSGKTLLKGRTARIVVTMGMPGFMYRLWFLSHGTAAMRRSILNFVGIRPVRETFYGMLEQASERTRKKWLAEVRAFGEKAI